MTSKVGNRTLAYTGVHAPTPPNITIHEIDPTTKNYFNFTIGDLWVNNGTISAPLNRIWILVSKRGVQVGGVIVPIATWVLLVNGGGGPVVGLQPDVGAIVNPLLGIILLHNTDGNVITSNGSPPTNRLNINLANNVTIPGNFTSTAGIVITTNGGIIAGNTIPGAANFAQLDMVKSRNGGAVLNGDILGSLQYLGNDGTNFAITGVEIRGVVSGPVAILTVPAEIQFWTTPNTGILTQRISILKTGGLQIFNPDSGLGLAVLGGGATIVGNFTNITAFGRVLNGSGIALLVDNAGGFGTVASSIRYKENINDMGSLSDDLMKLKPAIFNYKKDESKQLQFGLIAEEVEQIYPTLVSHNQQGELESVKYNDFIPLLLNEVQKLNKRIAQLEDLCYKKDLFNS